MGRNGNGRARILREFPKQGDLIYIDFNPSSGREIQRRRPAVVVSKTNFNRRTGFCVVCPITSTALNYPSVVCIRQTADRRISGSILTHQVKALDFTSRNWQFVERLPELEMAQVKLKLSYIFD